LQLVIIVNDVVAAESHCKKTPEEEETVQKKALCKMDMNIRIRVKGETLH
jgi:hypothetical protein